MSPRPPCKRLNTCSWIDVKKTKQGLRDVTILRMLGTPLTSRCHGQMRWRGGGHAIMNTHAQIGKRAHSCCKDYEHIYFKTQKESAVGGSPDKGSSLVSVHQVSFSLAKAQSTTCKFLAVTCSRGRVRGPPPISFGEITINAATHLVNLVYSSSPHR